jgi:exodeoxyribonuclease VII large subunit
VLTSESADGWNDFKRHLEGASVGFHVTLLPIKVQGEETRANVLGGLAWFAARASDFDCVCILRGGGSRTDLAWFDDMDIALAVAKHPIKVLIGIGHERDRSVLDEIAHSEKTPTAVAAFLADTVLGERRKVADRAIALQRSVGRLLQSETNWLSRAAVSLGSHASSRIRSERQQLDTAARDLRSHSLRAVAEGRRTLETAARTLQTFALQSCERKQHELARASDRARHGAMTMLQRAQHKLEQLADKQRLLDPRFVLRRGFALVRDEQGRVVPSAARIEQGQQITIQMRDGSVRTRAEAIENKP